MKLFKYNQFLRGDILNENLDKAKKFLKDRYILITAAKELNLLTGELAAQLKHGEKRTATMKDFTPEQQALLKSKMRDIKISDEQARTIERDPDFVKLRELLKDNLGYLYAFTYFYYVEMVGFKELEDLYNDLIENKQLLDKLPKKFDANFIDPNIDNNFEKLVDGINYIKDYRKIKKVIDKLTPELKKDYNNSPPAIKELFDGIAIAFTDELGKGDDGKIDTVKQEKLWKSFFGEVREIAGVGRRYFGSLRRYKNIREFIKAAQNFLVSSQNEGIVAFYDRIDKCNEKYGYLGADIVFDENGILIIEVKSFQANQMLNGHTRHCIKDYMSQWESYVTNRDAKQYYIYNFNIGQYDNKSVIGITIIPGRDKNYACHLKDDTGFRNQIKSQLQAWQKEYNISTDIYNDILIPISPEELARREKAKVANREIVKKGISIEQIKKYVKEDGADINKDRCIALVNAVEENDLEKVKVILSLGGSPNLRTGSEAAISKASTLDMIKLLVANGSELTSEVFNSIVDDVGAVEYCLNNGLDPNFGNSLPIRRACRGNYTDRTKESHGYFDVFKLLIDHGARLTDDRGRHMGIKWAAEYGRISFIEYMIRERNIRVGFKEAIDWVSHSRKMTDDAKAKVLDYLREKANKYESGK
jgi:hypothetical protein